MNEPQPDNPSDITNSGNSSSLPAGLQQAYDAFVQLEQIKNPIHQEYELLQAAKRCDLPLDSFRQMFKHYRRQQQDTKWRQSPLTSLLWRTEITLEWLNQRLSQMDIFPVLDYLSKLSIILGLIVYVGESGERDEQKLTQQRRANYEAWSVIRADEGRAHSGGRIDALQQLNQNKGSLAGVNLAGAYLSGVKLSQAQLNGATLNNARLNDANLQGAIFTKSDLHQANLINANLQEAFFFQANLRDAALSEANLTGATLSRANLVGANLAEAKLDKVDLENAIYNSETDFPPNFDPSKHSAVLLKPGANLQDKNFSEQDLTNLNLSQVNFKQANLKQANLQKANLENANLEGADLEAADLRAAKGLNITQLKGAKNWESANYDPLLRQQLGLSPVK